MSRETLIQSSFNAGALSPRLAGRTDFKKYGSATSDIKNIIPIVSGPASFRPGTVFINEVEDSAVKSRLIPFKFNTEQAFMLEFCDGKIRFYKDRGVVLSGGLPYELSTPYAEADLPNLSYVQDADVVYITLASDTIPPKVLVRISDTNWELRSIDFNDGPYLEANTSLTTITPSSTSGVVTLTASTAIFASTDVGRLVRYRPNSTANWGWLRITAYTSTTVVSAQCAVTLAGTTASTEWRLGAFSQTTGYPAIVSLHEGRLVYGRTRTKPNYIWLSESQGFGQQRVLFAPSASTGTVTDANSIFLPLSAGDVSTILWMSSGNVLAIGTADSEWVIESGDVTKALSPTNTRATRRTNQGSIESVNAVRIDGTVMFAKGTGSRVNRFVFDFNKDDYQSVNLSVLAEHYFQGKRIQEMVYVAEPFSLMWVRMDDGTLNALTFVDSEEVGGWSQHTIAGSFGSGDAVVESIATIPQSNAEYNELWMTVKRTIDGNTVRYIEVMEQPFFLGEPADAVYLDSALKYDGVATSTITGLDHLEGEEVYVLVDGANHPPQTVVGGEITLNSPAEKVVVGLYYQGDIDMLDFDAVNAFSGTSMGQIRRISEVQLRLYEAGLVYVGRVGQSDDDLTLVEPRDSDDLMDTATALLSGVIPVSTESEWSRTARVKVQFRSPMPATICTLTFKAQVNEG